jgi:hypothetical protein
MCNICATSPAQTKKATRKLSEWLIVLILDQILKFLFPPQNGQKASDR